MNLYPGLAEELERWAPETPDSGELRVEATPSGHPTLLLGGRHVHSPRDPVREAERLAESFRAAARGPSGEAASGNAVAGDTGGGETAPIVILGFGLGYSAEAAARAAPGRPLIIVEKRKDVLRLALKIRDLGALLSENRLIFVLGGDGGAAIQNALDLFKTAPGIIRNRALVAADEEWYAAVEQGIGAWLNREKVNQATLRRFGRRWVRNLARNMDAIRDLPGISRLQGVLAAGSGGNPVSGSGIPVFLAAAGPSLDGAGPLLGEIRKRCVVVAVDTSLRFMLGRGLDPDFAVVVDPQYWNFRHLDRCRAPRTWLVAESAVYPPVLRHQFRGAFLCRSQFPLGCFIEDRVDPKGALGAGGSVATSAWDFARVLGASAVWIAGLDLAFPGLKTHFRGALFETRSHAESDRFAPAETWSLRALQDGRPFLAAAADGGQVLTDQRLSLYASWFAGNFRKYPALRNYRLAPFAGIAIPGLENAGPEALLELPERREEIDSLLEGLYTRIAEDFRRDAGERERSYRAARTRLMEGLRAIAGEAAEAAALARDGLRRAGQGAGRAAEEDRILQRLDRALRSIKNSEVKEVAGFLFPPHEEFAAGDGQNGGQAGSDGGRDGGPFARYLESSGRLYQALAEAAAYQLEILGMVSETKRNP
ncbi:MAG: DUF115 domain-containing protein [Treponema sp.]|jgi:hypothetical protein|nr:DUF115 domain-containing protein [Treponema sp.]